MSNALATTGVGMNLLDMIASLPDLAADLGAEIGATGLNLRWSGKTGQFTFNGDVLPADTTIAINMPLTEKGTICYVGGQAAHQQSIPILARGEEVYSADQMNELEPGPFGDSEGWNRTFKFYLRFLDSGIETTMTLSGKIYPSGGIGGAPQAGYNLIKSWANNARMQLDAKGQPKIPLVQLGALEKLVSGSTVEKYYVPTLKIVRWERADVLQQELDDIRAARRGEGVVHDTAGEEAPAQIEAKPATPAKAPATSARAPGGFGSGVRGART